MSPENSAVAVVVATIIAFVVSYMKRGQKIKTLKQTIAVNKEVDDVVGEMSGSVPESFHIDRMLAGRASAKSAPSEGSDQRGVR